MTAVGRVRDVGRAGASLRWARWAASAVVAFATGCGGHASGPPVTSSGMRPIAMRATGAGRPPLAHVSRQGDAGSAVAVAVTTEGIAPERGAVPAVALAALVEARLAARGLPGVTVVGGWGGWRLRLLVAAADAPGTVDGVRQALLAPVDEHDAALAAVARKLDALAHRPLPDRALVDVAQCTGEAFGEGGDTAPTATELESWRRAAHGLGRVAFATAGDDAVAEAVATALAQGSAWPSAEASPPAATDAGDARPVVYDASGEIPPGAARIVVTARTPTPEQAVAAAPGLGDSRGPLASRLAAIDARPRVRSVVATAHGDGGCVATTVDVAARDLAFDAAARIATATALVQQELSVELADVSSPPDLARSLAAEAPDPREAAETAAWWSLAGRRSAGGLRIALTVGVASSRDTGVTARPVTGDALRSEIDRAILAWHSPAVEARTHVERGQGEVWLLLASPCATQAESSEDAGAAAAVATAAAARAASSAGDAEVEPFVASDGIGVLAHGPARPGESPLAHARRLADLAARAFAADSLDGDLLARARTSLLVRAGEPDGRALAALGGALAPGHPSWIAPAGTRFGLASTTDDAIALRAGSMRMAPLRVAVLANADDAQADAAARAVDRWIARRPGATRACPALASLATPRPGTIAVDVPTGSPSEALLAAPIPTGEDARTQATWLAAALDGPDGLLSRALDAGPAAMRTWSASVVGEPRSPALVVRMAGPDASLDGAVAQVRALLERLRQGGLADADRTRAASSVARAALAWSLDPRARTIRLWRGASPSPDPSLDALRAFAAATLRDEALVVVAARPPRLDAQGRPK